MKVAGRSALVQVAASSIPLFLAGIGIILRGGTYVLRTAGAATPRERRRVDTVFALSSLLTPFALGTVVGGIASGRVRVGNPGGSLASSWLNPTSLTIGVLAVASGAYLSAVFLSADAVRDRRPELAERFRLRALAAGVAAGTVALAGIVVLRLDAHTLFTHLTQGVGLPALIVSVLAGVATLAFVWRRLYDPARYTAALAVAATVAGWALAQQPRFLADLTIEQAAAGHNTQIALVVAVLAGAVILFPSLALLFRLTLAGRLTGPERVAAAAPPREPLPATTARSARLAGASLIAGIGLLTVADAGWAHALGVASLLAFVTCGYRALLHDDLAKPRPRSHPRSQ